jgi:pimeloyl-ACP methyl ester carboxylesterase
MPAPRAMHVELVRTVTRDGLRVDGALHLPLPLGEGLGEGALTAEARINPHPNPLPKGEGIANRPINALAPTAALLLHGVAGNFYSSSTFEPLIGRLEGLGIAALSVNTRGHDSVFGASLGNIRCRLGAAYETVDDCRLDIAAWIEFLKSRSYKRIVLIGHSLGAVKAVYVMAHEKFSGVTAVIAISAPRLSYSAFMNAPESSLFWESMHTAEELVKAGRGDELFTSKFPFPMLMTAVAYIDKYGPAERYNLIQFAADLPCPALFTYGSKELTHGGIAFAGVPDALAALPNADRRAVAVIEGADHVYTGVGENLSQEIVNWLRRLPMATSD